MLCWLKLCELENICLHAYSLRPQGPPGARAVFQLVISRKLCRKVGLRLVSGSGLPGRWGADSSNAIDHVPQRVRWVEERLADGERSQPLKAC